MRTSAKPASQEYLVKLTTSAIEYAEILGTLVWISGVRAAQINAIFVMVQVLIVLVVNLLIPLLILSYRIVKQIVLMIGDIH